MAKRAKRARAHSQGLGLTTRFNLSLFPTAAESEDTSSSEGSAGQMPHGGIEVESSAVDHTFDELLAELERSDQPDESAREVAASNVMVTEEQRLMEETCEEADIETIHAADELYPGPSDEEPSVSRGLGNDLDGLVQEHAGAGTADEEDEAASEPAMTDQEASILLGKV